MMCDEMYKQSIKVKGIDFDVLHFGF